MKQYYALIFLMLLSSCSGEAKTELDEIYAMMEGSFTSKKQSEKNSKYYNKSLHLAHIWEDREGKWVYAEYGLSDTPDVPYNQRVYQLITTADNSIEMRSYDLKDRQRFVGKWDSPQEFEAFTTEDLEAREGCSVYFRKNNEEYFGETRGENCNHNLGQAEYWTHQFIVSNDRIINWTRGFDTKDSLIWGLPEGGYILEKTR